MVVLSVFELYWSQFITLLVVPFQNLDMVWGILPIYASMILGEIYEGRMDFGRAVINGAVMLLAGLDWAWHLSRASNLAYLFSDMSLPWLVTAICIGLGVFTIILGLRRKDKPLAATLGHTRFSCYYIILLYPMQARLVPWSSSALVATLVFAIPAWVLIYGLGRLASRFLR